MTSSGPVSSERDIIAQTINTGQIEQRTELTINIIIDRLDQLAELLQQPGSHLLLDSPDELALRAGERRLALPPNLLEGFALLPRAEGVEARDRQRAYAAWLVTRQPRRPVQLLAARQHYIPLAGYVAEERDLLQPHLSERRIVGDGPQRQIERERLADVTQAVDRHAAFVLLGPPGSGKSTILQRLAYTAARAYLTGSGRRLPLLITLADYRWEQTPQPIDFVRRRWADHLAGDFIHLARNGQILLLADGLNEMLRLESSGERRRRANAWESFMNDYFAEASPQSSRAVIASRDQSDYDQPLGLPRVEIEPLDDGQIARFVQAYLPAAAEKLLAALHRLALWEQARLPYPLYILTQLYDPATGDLPPNRGRLFAQYAQALLLGERQAGHSWYEPEAALAALAELGYAMQQRGESTVLPAADIQAMLPAEVCLAGQPQPVATPPAAVFSLACRAALLLPDPTAAEAEAYKFSHQLLQEQFAAQHLLARWQAGDPAIAQLWRSPRTPAEMPEPRVGKWDPLPPPPTGGWEQTTILAAGLADPPDAFIRAVLAASPALAGRCLAEGNLQVDPDTAAAVQQALLADLGNPGLHRRARIQAGRILGAVGDPRFEPVQLGPTQLVLPDLIHIPGGAALLGSRRWPFDRQAYANERPQHRLEVASFYLARYPVSNAEYRCFIEAGGYNTEAYWTPAGWQWRQGELAESGPVEDIVRLYHYFLNNPREIDQRLKDERITPETAEGWRALINLSEEEVRQQALQAFPVQPREQPYYWDDPAYNGLNQPVVGVTWYEAMAYCAWLNERLHEWATGKWPMTNQQVALWSEIKSKIQNGLSGLFPEKSKIEIRLPTEAEWEWAAGGPEHHRYPWGRRFDPDKANTLEGRVLQTTPLGAYPAGAAPCGAQDLCGNVWEWTHSLYQPYPYRQEDGREDPLAGGRPTLRGGAWYFDRRLARLSYRDNNQPGYFDYVVGFRVVLAPVL